MAEEEDYIELLGIKKQGNIRLQVGTLPSQTPLYRHFLRDDP